MMDRMSKTGNQHTTKTPIVVMSVCVSLGHTSTLRKLCPASCSHEYSAERRLRAATKNCALDICMALGPPRGRWLPGLYIGTTEVVTRFVLPPAERCLDAEGGCLEEDERRGKKSRICPFSRPEGRPARRRLAQPPLRLEEDGGQSGPCGRGWSERRGAVAVKLPEVTRFVLPPAERCPDGEGGCLDEDERRGKNPSA